MSVQEFLLFLHQIDNLAIGLSENRKMIKLLQCAALSSLCSLLVGCATKRTWVVNEADRSQLKSMQIIDKSTQEPIRDVWAVVPVSREKAYLADGQPRGAAEPDVIIGSLSRLPDFYTKDCAFMLWPLAFGTFAYPGPIFLYKDGYLPAKLEGYFALAAESQDRVIPQRVEMVKASPAEIMYALVDAVSQATIVPELTGKPPPKADLWRKNLKTKLIKGLEASR
jgi:hypothetical protein